LRLKVYVFFSIWIRRICGTLKSSVPSGTRRTAILSC
jgi:hypothetical protein